MKRLSAPVIGVGLSLALLAAGLAAVILNQEQNEIARASKAHAEEIGGVLRSTIQERAFAMDRMAARWNFGLRSHEDAWRVDASNYHAHMKGMQALSWADVTSTVRWIEPRDLSAKYLGYKMSSESVRAAAISKVRTTRASVMTPIIAVRAGYQGFLIMAPVWEHNEFDGVVIAAFDSQKFVQEVISSWGYEIKILEDTHGVYRTAGYTIDESSPYNGNSVIKFNGITWTIQVRPTPATLAAQHSYLPSGVLVAGLLLALLAALLAHSFLNERSTRRALRKSLEWQLSIVNGSDFLFISTDAQGIVESINPVACELLGYTADELVGKQTPALWHDPQEVAARARALTIELGRPVLPGFEAFVAKAKLGVVDQNHWTVVTRAGKRVPVSLSSHAIHDVNGSISGYVGILEDLTLTLQREADLKTALTTAQNAVQTRSLFLANMSHEIRTPLNGVIGLAEILMGTPLDGLQRMYAGNIQKCAEILLALVNDVLDLSKIESGKLEVETINYDLNDLIQGFTFLVRSSTEKKGLAYREMIADELPRFLRGDPTRIRQILMNLLGNAVKFTDRGEVELRIEQYEDAKRAGRRIRFSVRDTGIGIPEPRLASLFEDYIQGDASTTRRYGGTGLGLAISKRLAALMGGEIGVRSQIGQGTVFWLEIPEIVGEAAEVERPTCDFPASTPAPSHHVLVAEDNTINQLVVTKYLERLGHTYKVVEDGEAAIEALERESFDVVLMDCQMPHMDGPEATRILRTSLSARVRATPIIAVTAGVMDSERAACFEAGMQGYLAKPISLQALEAEMKRVIALAVRKAA